MTPPPRQPEHFFLTFLEALKPAIEKFGAGKVTRWSVPYQMLLGYKYGVLASWRSGRAMPEPAYQHALSLMALREIADLDPDRATVRDAQRIAAGRFSSVLDEMPDESTQRKAAEPPLSPDDETLIHDLRAAGLTAKEIARKVDHLPRVVQRVLAKAPPTQRRSTPADIKEARRLLNAGMSPREISTLMGFSYSTILNMLVRAAEPSDARESELA